MATSRRSNILFWIVLSLLVGPWSQAGRVGAAVTTSTASTTWQVLQHAFHRYGTSPYPDFIPWQSAGPAATGAAAAAADAPLPGAAAAAAAAEHDPPDEAAGGSRQAAMQCSAHGTCSTLAAAQQALGPGAHPPPGSAAPADAQQQHQQPQHPHSLQHQQQRDDRAPSDPTPHTQHEPAGAGAQGSLPAQGSQQASGGEAQREPPAPAPAPAAAPAKPHRPPPVRRLLNLAELSDGASVLAANPEARRPERAIDRDIDSFMKNDCDAEKWMMIELSQLGTVETVKLTMKELYSSRVHTFRVLGRSSHPRKDGPDLTASLTSGAWQLLGSFTAENKRGTQAFSLPQRSRVRYLLLLFDTHYGNEQICAMNWIEVLGVSAAQELEEALALQELEAEHEEQQTQGSPPQEQQQQLARHVPLPQHQQQQQHPPPPHYPAALQHHHQQQQQQHYEQYHPHHYQQQQYQHQQQYHPHGDPRQQHEWQQRRDVPEHWQERGPPHAEHPQQQQEGHAVAGGPIPQGHTDAVASKQFAAHAAAAVSPGEDVPVGSDESSTAASSASPGDQGGVQDGPDHQQQQQQPHAPAADAGQQAAAAARAPAGQTKPSEQDSSAQADGAEGESAVQQPKPSTTSSSSSKAPAAQQEPPTARQLLQDGQQQQPTGAAGSGPASAADTRPASQSGSAPAASSQQAAGATGQSSQEGSLSPSGLHTGDSRQQQQPQEEDSKQRRSPGRKEPAAAAATGQEQQDSGQQQQVHGATGSEQPSRAPAAADVLSGPAAGTGQDAAAAAAASHAAFSPPSHAHPPPTQQQQAPTGATGSSSNGNGNGHHAAPPPQQQTGQTGGLSAAAPSQQQQQQQQQQARDTGSVLDSRGSNKPKQAGNLFDVVKSEMMQLKLDQGKLSKKVDGLTKRSSDFDATAAALQQQQAALSSQIERLSKKLDALVGTQAAANAAQQQLRKDVSVLLAEKHKEQRGFYYQRRSSVAGRGARGVDFEDVLSQDVHVTAEPGSSLDTPRRPLVPPVCARPPGEVQPLLLQSRYQWSVVTALASTSLLGLWLVLHPKSLGFPQVPRLVVCVLALLNGVLAVLLGLWLLVMQGLAVQQQRVLLLSTDPRMSMPVYRMLGNGSGWGDAAPL